MIRKTQAKKWIGSCLVRSPLAILLTASVMVFGLPFLAISANFSEAGQDAWQGVMVAAQVQSESGDQEAAEDESADEPMDLEDVAEDRQEAPQEQAAGIADPLEPWNRVWYHFNDRLYFWMLKPAAQGYKAVVPEDFRVSMSNAYTNATAPVRIFNSLFQLKFEKFFVELSRFLINTTMGFVGFRDCARDCFGIKPHDEDFGQTLGYYGVGHGLYLVWPFLGPSSVRDTMGKGADSILSFTGLFAPVDLETAVWAGLKVHELINDTSLRIGDYEAVQKAAIDPYVAIRDGYAQRRKKAVQE